MQSTWERWRELGWSGSVCLPVDSSEVASSGSFQWVVWVLWLGEEGGERERGRREEGGKREKEGCIMRKERSQGVINEDT